MSHFDNVLRKLVQRKCIVDESVAVTGPINDVIKSSKVIAATKTQSQPNSLINQQTILSYG